MLRQANSELDIIYNFYKDISADEFVGGYCYDDGKDKNSETIFRIFNGNAHYDLFTNFLMDFYQKNGFMKIISDEEFDKLDGILVFRGEHQYEYTKTLINSPTYHYGSGSYGEGIYTTNDIKRAHMFSHGGRDDMSYVCSYLIDKNAKVLDYGDLVKIYFYLDKNVRKTKLKDKIKLAYKDRHDIQSPELDKETMQRLDNLIAFLNKKGDNNFKKKFTRFDTNAIAVYLGFDVIERREDSFTNDYIVLNRGMLCISESEKERVMNFNDEVIQIR